MLRLFEGYKSNCKRGKTMNPTQTFSYLFFFLSKQWKVILFSFLSFPSSSIKPNKALG